MVRYDNHFANAWQVDVEVTMQARYFILYEIDDQHQWLPEKKEITKNVIAYEGLRSKILFIRKNRLKSEPCAIGDGPHGQKVNRKFRCSVLYSQCSSRNLWCHRRKTNVEKSSNQLHRH